MELEFKCDECDKAHKITIPPTIQQPHPTTGAIETRTITVIDGQIVYVPERFQVCNAEANCYYAASLVNPLTTPVPPSLQNYYPVFSTT